LDHDGPIFFGFSDDDDYYYDDDNDDERERCDLHIPSHDLTSVSDMAALN
jgi:hypothetical protein